MKTMPLWCDEELEAEESALTADEMLQQGASLVISVSGGKDSQAMAEWLLHRRQTEGWTGDVHMVHADLGRAEWSMTEAYVIEYARRKNVALHIVRRNDALDLVDIIDRRRKKLEGTDKPFWPSSAARYCTSDLKRAVVDVWLRNHYPSGQIVTAMGMRAEESPARKKMPVNSLRPNCQSKGRYVLNWLPIHEWSLGQVWDAILPNGGIQFYQDAWKMWQRDEGFTPAAFLGFIRKMTGQLPCHPAYMFGNSRLSCALCVLADQNDLKNGAVHNPEPYQLYTRWEMESGMSFQQNRWLCDLHPDLLDSDVYQWWAEKISA